MGKRKLKINNSDGKQYLFIFNLNCFIITYLIINNYLLGIYKKKLFSIFICYNLDWTVVHFIDDSIIQLCPGKSFKKKIIIGHNYYVKWKDGYKYLAVVLNRGSKFIIYQSIN